MTFQNKIQLLFSLAILVFTSTEFKSQDKFPDGTVIPKWFKENKPTDINTLGEKYLITDFGVMNDSTILQPNNFKVLLMKLQKKVELSSFRKELFLSVRFSSNKERIYI